MPFRSEKQRKYLWIHEPAIAKRWSKKYGSKIVKSKKKKKRKSQVLQTAKKYLKS